MDLTVEEADLEVNVELDKESLACQSLGNRRLRLATGAEEPSPVGLGRLLPNLLGPSGGSAAGAYPKRASCIALSRASEPVSFRCGGFGGVGDQGIS